jgi:hypothetical protein
MFFWKTLCFNSFKGLAAWILEKYKSWSDCKGDIESKFTKDELLTVVMIYWVTNTINSSFRLYCETKKNGRFGVPECKGNLFAISSKNSHTLKSKFLLVVQFFLLSVCAFLENGLYFRNFIV